MSKTNLFIVVWDQLGLEYVGNVTQDEQRRVWGELQGKPVPSELPNINHIMLRARVNSHRHYEIYLVNAVKGIDVEEIREMFENNPQHAADTIRRLGHCYYSNRAEQAPAII